MDEILKLLQDIKESQQMVELHKRRLDKLVPQVQTSLSVLKEEGDEKKIKELIHHLYWQQNMSAKEVADLTGKNIKNIWKLAGPTYTNQTCDTCQQNFIIQVESKNQKLDTTCNFCKHDAYQKNRTKVLSLYLGKNVPKNYDKYLQGKHWKNTRKSALERADFQCQLCSCKDSVLEVHHNNYDNIGKEKPKDLIVLCRPCHRKFHTK
tara:strand:- start:176 stop:796 length:621 start_codon:yes stop_codon:yes gene_type:complete